MTETQAPQPSNDILARIVETKRAEVDRLKPRLGEFRERARAARPARGLRRALTADTGSVAVIAEVKRRSPGAGDIRPGLDPGALAAAYEGAGAAAISVLTDGPWFGGALADLEAVRARVEIPLLRKDFTLDPVQVFEARAAGADAVLLIARILDDDALALLLDVADEAGLDALVEVHDLEELSRALRAGARLLGVNNRDLSTFRTDLAVTEALLGRVPGDAVVVSESGIGDGADVARVGAAGAQAVLVGETILRAADPAAKVAELTGHARVAAVTPGERPSPERGASGG